MEKNLRMMNQKMTRKRIFKRDPLERKLVRWRMIVIKRMRVKMNKKTEKVMKKMKKMIKMMKMVMRKKKRKRKKRNKNLLNLKFYHLDPLEV